MKGGACANEKNNGFGAGRRYDNARIVLMRQKK